MSAMTEDEAREKWCPHAVASHTDPRRGFRGEAPTNLDGRERQVEKEFPCIASACMAWRWAGGPRKADEVRPHMREGETLGQAYSRMCRGYCGLAGGPDR